MENASKALIIAGAILLSILLIALGVYLLNGATDTAKRMGNMDDSEINAFNSKFQQYEGEKITAAQVKNLIDLVRTHNNTNASDFTKLVNIKASAASDTKVKTGPLTINYATLKSAIKSAYTYTVSISFTEGVGTVAEVGFVRDN